MVFLTYVILAICRMVPLSVKCNSDATRSPPQIGLRQLPKMVTCMPWTVVRNT
jgi:hypothetical protein